MICGPLRKSPDGLVMMVVDGFGIPSSIISTRIFLPSFFEVQLKEDDQRKVLPPEIWDKPGPLQAVFGAGPFQFLGRPLLWKGERVGAILGWRSGGAPFKPQEDLILRRLTGIATLAFHAC